MLHDIIYAQFFRWPELVIPFAVLVIATILVLFIPNKIIRLILVAIICGLIPLYWHHHVRSSMISSAVLAMSFSDARNISIQPKNIPFIQPLYTLSTVDHAHQITVSQSTLNAILIGAGHADWIKTTFQSK